MGLFFLYMAFGVVMLLLANYYFFPKPKPIQKAPEQPEREIVYVQVPVLVPVFTPTPVEEEKVDDEPYRKEITPAVQKQIDDQMDRFLESNPNYTFFQDYPHYVESYLSRVDISELGLTVMDDEEDPDSPK